MTAKIVCGFLNNEGGILYYGIHDSGTIKGIEPYSDEDFYDFYSKLLKRFKKFSPAISTEDWKMKVIEIV